MLSRIRANQLSVLTGSATIAVLTIAFWRWVGIGTPAMAWAIGAFWMVLTIAFEFGFGRLVTGASWEGLWGDYDLSRGRLWPLVLLTTLVAPRAVALWRGS
jgi:hypothetical protein